MALNLYNTDGAFLVGLDALRYDPLDSTRTKTYRDFAHSASDRTYQFLEELKSRAKRYRKKYFDNLWATYYRAFIGSQWPSGSLSGWKSRLVINYIYKIIERMASMMTDQRPKMTLMAPTEAQAKYVDTLHSVMDFVWFNQDMDLKMVDFLKCGLLYGTGWLKVYWDPRLHDGMGDIQIDVANPFEVWIDPNATSIKDASYFIWEREMSIAEALRRWPYLSDKISFIAGLAYSDRKEEKFDHGFPDFSGEFPLRSPVQYDQVNRDVPWLEPPPSMGGMGDNLSVTEVWVRDYSTRKDEKTGNQVPKYYKNTRLIQYIGPLKLYDGSTPYEFSGFPWVQWKDIALPQEPYGISTVSQLWSIQKELNRRRSQLMSYADYMSNPLWIIDDMAMRDTTQLTTMPGAIIKKMQGTEARREAPPPIPNSMFQLVETAIRDMMEVSGFEMPGKKQAEARSGVAMESIQEASTGIIRLKVRGLEAALRHLGSLMIRYIQQFYTESRIIRIMSDPSKVEFTEFQGGWIQGDWDISIGAGSTLPVSKYARFAQALQLYQSGALDVQGLLEYADWPDKTGVLKRLAQRSQEQEKHEMEMAVFRQKAKSLQGGQRGGKMKGARPIAPAPLLQNESSGSPL